MIYGHSAFSLPWDQPDVEIPFVARKNLDVEDKQYLCMLKGLLAEKGLYSPGISFASIIQADNSTDEELRAVKAQYGQPYAWRSRLFLDDNSVL